MPELPEVETVRRTLLRHVQGRKITSVEVRDSRLRVRVPRGSLSRLVVGREITGVRRRAKYLLVDVDGGAAVLLHLGMSGRLRIMAKDDQHRKHDHVVFGLDDGHRLCFNDARRFGLVLPIRPGEEATQPQLRHLGIEPLDGGLDAETMWRVSRGLTKPVKNYLLDGTRIVGIGNIYACEVLFAARLSPKRPVGRLTVVEWRRLTKAITRTLDDAIDKGGTTLRDFLDVEGEAGYFAIRLKAYGREGEACRCCAGRIRRIVQSGRSTFYCARCQR
jgi:formamidopyrimidine-DNA glycosylase